MEEAGGTEAAEPANYTRDLGPLSQQESEITEEFEAEERCNEISRFIQSVNIY